MDHIGIVFFPKVAIFRIIGRLAFPIFAYAVFEGSRYTRHPGAYLARLSGLGVLCFLVYFFFDGAVYGNVLITLSLSACILLHLRDLKENLLEHGNSTRNVIWSGIGFFGSITLTAVLCSLFPVDYGFCGVMLPVFPALFDRCFAKEPQYPSQKEDRIFPLLSFFAGLVLLSISMGRYQFYCGLSVLLLIAATGKRGTLRLKYLFYFYYPLHLLVIELLSLLFFKR